MRGTRFSAGQMPRVCAIFLALLTIVAIVAPTQAAEFRIWTDKTVYYYGETVTIHIQPAPALGVAYWLIVWKPDGSQTRIDLGTGQRTASSIAGPPPGQRRVELWGQVVAPDTTPELYADCEFEVEGEAPAQLRIWTDKTLYYYGEPVTIHIQPVPALGVTYWLIIWKPDGSQTRVDLTAGQGTATSTAGPPPGQRKVELWGQVVAPNTSPQLYAHCYYEVQGKAFDFTIALSPTSQRVQQAETATFRIMVTYNDPSWSGTTIDIQVTGLGPGMTWSSTPGGDLFISVSPSAQTGTYTITVTGSAQGVTHQTSASLDVVPKAPTFDFAVSVSPSSQAVAMGDRTSFSATVSLVSGSAESVSFSLSGLPAGVSYSFSPQTGTPTFSSTLYIDTTAGAPTGTYSLTVIGSGGGLTRTASIQLTLEKKAKRPSSISVSVSVQEEKVTVSGSISPARPGTVTLDFEAQDGSTFSDTTTASQSGLFTYGFSPPKAGVWTLAASWQGDEEYDGATSGTVAFTVQEKGILDLIPGGMAGLVGIIALIIVLAALILLARGRARPPASRTEEASLSAETRFCGNCGKPTQVQMKFCPHCGTKQST